MRAIYPRRHRRCPSRHHRHTRIRGGTYIHTYNTTISLSIALKINRVEPFLQIQIAGRGKPAVFRWFLAIHSSSFLFFLLFSFISLFDFRKLFDEPLTKSTRTTRHGSAIRCQNKKFDSRDRRELRVSPTRACAIDLHSVNFPPQGERDDDVE